MKLILPLTVVLPRKKGAGKVLTLNLNYYRNTHFQVLNQAKDAYRDLVRDAYFYYCQLPGNENLPEPPYLFCYTVYPKSRRMFDLANILSIIQKFTDDALIALGVISDDSYKVIRAVNYRFGGIDRKSPHCELDIFPYRDDGII